MGNLLETLKLFEKSKESLNLGRNHFGIMVGTTVFIVGIIGAIIGITGTKGITVGITGIIVGIIEFKEIRMGIIGIMMGIKGIIVRIT